MKVIPKKNSELHKRVFSGILMCILTISCIMAGRIINMVFFSFCFMCAISEWYNISLKIAKIKRKMWIFYEEKTDKTNFSTRYNTKFFIIFSIGLLYIFIAFYNLFIFSIFKWPAFFILGTSTFTDTFAYIGGKHFQGKKLCPKISPGKTISGFICGILASGIFSTLTRGNWDLMSTIIIFLQGVFLGMISQAGDLLESYVKRKANLKNSGNLIPGHGGILDRVDGTLSISFIISLYFLLF